MDLLVKIVITAAAVSFIAGLLLTAVTGSARPVKIFLGILAIIFSIGIVAGFIVSQGLFVYLLFQIISLAIILFFVVILGAVCGGGIYLLLHKKPRGKSLTRLDIEEYLPAAEFSTLEGITEERALLRINGGFYRGGLYEGNWYIHKSELSQKKLL
jgi:hypothetical protein